MPFALGQRWISDTESDLGLGTVVAIEGRMLTLLFPASGETRLYAKHDAPVTRVVFNVGDQVQSAEGWQLDVTELSEQDGLITYYGKRTDTGENSIALKETLLDHFIKFNKPQDRLFAGQIDRMDRFVLRYDCLRQQHQLLASPLRGLLGGRTSLIPHQLHIAREVGARYAPRVLLADEVGLGKTIEAGQIIHQQLLSSRAHRVLILVPETLQHQWLVEMLRRFNLRFSLFDEERCIEAFADSENPFETEQLVLCSLDFLRKRRTRFEQALDAEWDLLVVDEAHHLKWSEDRPSREYQVVEALSEEIPGLLLLTATPEQLGMESHFARLRLLDPERFYDFDAFVEEQDSYRPVADAVADLLSDKPLTDAQSNALSELLSEQDIEPQLVVLNSAGSSTDARDSARDELLANLLDRHGTGRVLFRNTRAAVKGFPGRELHSYQLALPSQYATALRVASMLLGNLSEEERLHHLLNPHAIYQLFEGGDAPAASSSSDGSGAEEAGENTETTPSWTQHDPRVSWLLDFLQANSDEKVLVICHKAETAKALVQALRTREAIQAAVFHEDMSIIERDRAGAWFAQQEDGAQVLICSEIGSEGRNFQFAHQLVMFDLPLNPDLLEQRIGRLDRIGQRQTVKIHVPFLADTCQGTLLRWHDEGLEAFSAPCAAAAQLFDAQEKNLRQLLLAGATPGSEEVEELVQQTRTQHAELKAQLEQGRDRLLELHSGGREHGEALAAEISDIDDQTALPTFMFKLFDVAGVNQEDKGENALVVKPTEHMLLTGFPGLPNDGCTVTFDRQTALARDDMQFLSWDHPMVQGGIDMILSSELGSTSVALLKNRALPAGTVLLELVYLLEATAPAELQLGRFLPPTPLRLLLDKTGKNLAEQVPFEGMNSQLTPVNRHIGSKLASGAQPVIHPLLAQGEQLAQTQLQPVIDEARSQMSQLLGDEINRLQALKAVNPNIRDVEVDYFVNQREQLERYLDQAGLRLDAMRLIVVAHQ